MWRLTCKRANAIADWISCGVLEGEIEERWTQGDQDLYYQQQGRQASYYTFVCCMAIHGRDWSFSSRAEYHIGRQSDHHRLSRPTILYEYSRDVFFIEKFLSCRGLPSRCGGGVGVYFMTAGCLTPLHKYLQRHTRRKCFDRSDNALSNQLKERSDTSTFTWP